MLNAVHFMSSQAHSLDLASVASFAQARNSSGLPGTV